MVNTNKDTDNNLDEIKKLLKDKSYLHGVLEKGGKKADLILLNQNLFSIPENEILNTKVISTYINGEQVYHN